MFAKVYPVLDLLYNADRPAALLPVPDGWSPVNKGVCKPFLEDPLTSGKEKHRQYGNLERVQEFASFGLFDMATSTPDLIPWYEAQLSYTNAPSATPGEEGGGGEETEESGPPTEPCSLMGGLAALGTTTVDCCVFLNDAGSQILTGTTADAFSNSMSCYSVNNPNCYEASMIALNTAKSILGVDYPTQFATGCEGVDVPPSPAPTSADNVVEDCRPFQGVEGIGEEQSVGECLKSCCQVLKDRQSTPSADYGFELGTSVLCGDDMCRSAGVEYLRVVDVSRGGDGTDKVLMEAAFGRECVGIEGERERKREIEKERKREKEEKKERERVFSFWEFSNLINPFINTTLNRFIQPPSGSRRRRAAHPTWPTRAAGTRTSTPVTRSFRLAA